MTDNGFYQDLSSKQILEKLLLLRLCGSEKFIKNAQKIHGASATVFGERMTGWVMKHAMVKHFVTADNYQDYAEEAQKMLRRKVTCTMVPSMEDVSDDFTSETATWCRSNKDKFLREQEIVVELNKELGASNNMQFKLSSVFPTFAMNAYSRACHAKKVPLVDGGRAIGLYFNSGVTGVFDLLDSDKEKTAMRVGLDLARETFETSAHRSVPLLIDAELSSAHTAMFAVFLGASMMEAQRGVPLYVTYQCYIKNMTQQIEETIDACRQLDVPFGAKVVRGAYLDMEREIAKVSGTADPTWPSAEATSKCYNDAVDHCLAHIKEHPDSALCIATHNQESVDLAKDSIEQLRLAKDNPSIFFAQLYGMCDHITFSLGRDGYNVSKAMPYGKGSEWIPYLVRRASENHTAIATARNEAPMYRRELRRRLKL